MIMAWNGETNFSTGASNLSAPSANNFYDNSNTYSTSGGYFSSYNNVPHYDPDHPPDFKPTTTKPLQTKTASWHEIHQYHKVGEHPVSSQRYSIQDQSQSTQSVSTSKQQIELSSTGGSTSKTSSQVLISSFNSATATLSASLPPSALLNQPQTNIALNSISNSTTQNEVKVQEAYQNFSYPRPIPYTSSPSDKTQERLSMGFSNETTDSIVQRSTQLTTPAVEPLVSVPLETPRSSYPFGTSRGESVVGTPLSGKTPTINLVEMSSGRRRFSPKDGDRQRRTLPAVPIRRRSTDERTFLETVASTLRRLAYILVEVFALVETNIVDRWRSATQSSLLPGYGSHIRLHVFDRFVRRIRQNQVIASLDPELTRHPGFIPMLFCLTSLVLILVILILHGIV